MLSRVEEADGSVPADGDPPAVDSRTTSRCTNAAASIAIVIPLPPAGLASLPAVRFRGD